MTHTYTLLYPIISCTYCLGRWSCDACHGTREIKHGLDSTPYGWSNRSEVLRWDEVHSGEMDGKDHEIAESVFRLFNIGDRPVAVRSMSVGDRIVIDGERTYVCSPIGFDLVTN